MMLARNYINAWLLVRAESTRRRRRHRPPEKQRVGHFRTLWKREPASVVLRCKDAAAEARRQDDSVIVVFKIIVRLACCPTHGPPTAKTERAKRASGTKPRFADGENQNSPTQTREMLSVPPRHASGFQECCATPRVTHAT